jgi:endoglucanase
MVLPDTGKNRQRMDMKHLRAFLIGLLMASSGYAAGFLHTQGEDIADDNGNKVMLRGVGLGNWMLPEGYMWHFEGGVDRPRRIEKLISDLIGPEESEAFWHEYRSNYVTEADIARIGELGFNSVRPALNARLFLTEGEAPQEVPEGFAILDNLVSWAGRHGIYVIIDMHAAPGGQTGQNIDDSDDDQPRLFMDPQNQERLVNLWVKIARRYADNPAVAAYDLLNEPLPKRTGAEDKFKSQLQPLYERITRAIREVDPKHMVTVEGSDWANDWSAFSPPAFDKNVVYQFHYYCWDRPAKLKGIEQYLEFREKVNAPVWVGETGEANDTIYWGTTEYFESKNIGWSFWPWKKMDARNGPYSIKPPADWNQIVAFSRGGPKPSPEVARRAFAELLQNIKLENCRYLPDVVNSLLRRAPVKIEAEDYGQGGLNVSYYVKHPEQHARLFRVSEPVPIESAGVGEGRYRSGQAIQLTGGEWTQYTINSPGAATYHLTVRARSERAEPSTLELLVNEAPLDATMTNSVWADYNLSPIDLRAGPNQIKVLVKSGVAGIDWLNVTTE